MLNKNILRMTVFDFLFFIMSIPCFASIPGAYVGLQLGVSNIGPSGISRAEMGDLIVDALGTHEYQITSFSTGANAFGIAGRIYAGIQANCYFAAELGYTKFPNLPMRAKATGTSAILFDPFSVDTSGTFMLDAVDFVGKGVLPLPYHFNLYGKLGAAFIEYRPVITSYFRVHEVVRVTNQKFVDQRFFPTFGLGVSYDFTPCVQSDLSWNRIQRIGNDSRLGSTDFLSLGLNYYIGVF